MGAYGRSTSKEHVTHDCAWPDQSQGRPTGGEFRSCFHCRKDGHYQSECPKLQTGQIKGSEDVGRSTKSKGLTTKPRMYELSKDENASGSYESITGKNLNLSFQFSSHAWYGT